KVTSFEGTGYIGTKITYQLTSQPSLKLYIILKLYGEGLAENYYEIENIRDTETEQPVWVNQSNFLDLDHAVFPYRDQIIAMNDSIGNSYEYWDDRKLTENWLFIKDNVNPIGMAWDNKDKILF